MASVFKEAGIIEKYGSGIKRVRKVLKSAGAPPPSFESLPDLFKVTLYPIPSATGERVGGVNGGVMAVMNYVQRHPGTRSPEMSEALSLSARAVERHLRYLKESGEIVFTGAPKTGGYMLTGEIHGGVERDGLPRNRSATGEGVGGVSGGVNGGVNEGVNGGVTGGVTEGVRSLRLAIEQEPGNRLPFYADKLGVPVA